jgi:heavy metal sensor kinase
MTLRVRFALWVVGLLLTALAAFGAYVYLNLKQGLEASIDDSLRLSASQVIATINVENGQLEIGDSLPDSDSTLDLRERGLTLRILDGTGRVLQTFGPYRALPAEAYSLTAAQEGHSGFVTWSNPAQGDLVRVYTVPIIQNGQPVGIVQVAQTLKTVREALDHLLSALLLGGPLLMLVAAAGGYLLAARALAPIDHITRTARHISAYDLSARLDLPAADDEVGHLVTTFNEMLARLDDDSFRRERQFTTDASHDLRTPLAAMQAILSVIREEQRTPEDYELALADLSEETDRLRGLVEDLLRLARGDTRQIAVDATVDLSILLRDVTDSLRPLAEAKGLTLTYRSPDSIILPGDSDALIRLFVNLLDNAMKYTERGRIDVVARADPDGPRVTVSDTGIGIPPAHLPRIFDRFYRVERARSAPGAGLGLAIALDIARAHGGTIDVSSVVGQGTNFIVKFPRPASKH